MMKDEIFNQIFSEEEFSCYRDDLKLLTFLLYEHFKNFESARKWIFTGRPEWFGESPIDLIRIGRTDFVIDYFKQITDPHSDIFNG